MKHFFKFYIPLIFFIFLLFNSGLSGSDANATIQGQITDTGTKEPLPSVNVMVVHTNIGVATDINGHYCLTNISPGRIHLVASMIGYKKKNKTITLEPEQNISVNFELESTILEMGAVVVTGTATPHLIEDMPVRTEVIPRKLIERKQAANLAEALSFHTGIRVENNCQNCNFSQVRILGMDGKYSQILIDGDPVVSSLAGVYGLEHFPDEMIDQIEIVKGGGSSLYGGGAVAGVINMITRRPMSNQVRIKYLGHSTNGKFDQHVGAVAETVNKTGSSGAYVFGSFRKRNPIDQNMDGYSELGELNNESMGFKWYYKPLENSELLTAFHRIHEERRGGNKFKLPVHEAEIAEWIEHWRSGGTLRWKHRPNPLFDYRLYYSFSEENRKSYYGGLDSNSPEDRLNALSFYGRAENPLHITGFQTNYQLSGQLLTAGLQYTYDKIRDETAAETAYHLDEVYRNTGLFLQDNLHFGPNEEIEFVLGVRFDKHSELTNWIISPRINMKFDIEKDFILRCAYTTGFKPPQTYDEDLHLCGIEGDQRIIRNAPDLKEEKSYTLSAGFEYRGYLNRIPAMASITVFRTRLNDSFTEQFVSKTGSIEKWERLNSEGAEVKGVELDMGIRPIPEIELRGGFTCQISRYDSPHEDFHTKDFLRTPDLTANLRFNASPSNRIDCYILGNYIGNAYVPHEVIVKEREEPELRLERSDRFFHIDIGIIYRLPLNNGLNSKVSLGIKNITNAFQKDLDQGPDRDPAYVYGPARPRTLYFGLETAF
ncbi:TonB-dependent receptor [bacterium]|nr:TonB-dependent receptor [bacterium]RQV97966.1 MAG: TonB-dependent receptor [bacterium]